MSLALSAIRFNHDSTTSGTSALNVRKNAAEIVPIPEWRRGISVNPEDSVAAYAIQETQLRTLTVQAEFLRTDPQLGSVEIRALTPALPSFLDSYLQWALSPLLAWPTYYSAVYVYYTEQLADYLGGNVLGEVQARQVSFQADGSSGFQTFVLPRPRHALRGVGIDDIAWRWQFRRSLLDPWTDFATSRHRIYTVLETPTAPWQQFPFDNSNTQLPWTDVLDYACRWAAGAHTWDEAASRITHAVYDLGRDTIEYGCPIMALTQYAILFFNCTAFLERLRGGIGNGPYVNCTDCATFVSTFANCVGCDLWQSRMGTQPGPFFVTNPILAIGSSIWQMPCGFGPGFNYHEVAWKGACGDDDAVFDACLELNGSFTPWQAPFIPLLPANILFGRPGAGLYRDHLASPFGPARLLCRPDPLTRQRRFVI